jgi:hypothetical protein
VVGRLSDGYYPFFSSFEILATASVVVYAARWIRERRASDSFDSVTVRTALRSENAYQSARHGSAPLSTLAAVQWPLASS